MLMLHFNDDVTCDETGFVGCKKGDFMTAGYFQVVCIVRLPSGSHPVVEWL